MVAPPLVINPTSAYQNPPIEPQFFQPSRFIISAISYGATTIVTTTVNLNYVIGQQVRFVIPQQYGAIELNGQLGYVISLPSASEVEVNIVSNGFTAFNDSPTFAPQNLSPPQILAVGEINSGSINSSGRIQNGTYIPGSFLNISPI